MRARWLAAAGAAAAGALGAATLALAGPAAPASAGSPEHIVATYYASATGAGWQQIEAAAPTVAYAIVDICAPDGSGSYFGSKEILQVFEGTAKAFESATFPAWIKSHPPSQFSATLAAGTSATVGTDVTRAVKDGIGNFYENDEAEPPSYATLPSFWKQEVNDVAAAP